MPGRLFYGAGLLALLSACGSRQAEPAEPVGSAVLHERADERRAMVESQIAARGVTDTAVLEALRHVPRHRFMPREMQPFAYADRPLPIGEGQTISQPYIVAFMTQALELERGERMLEIGTGSGYQAAVLTEVAAEVYSIEIVPALAERAGALLKELEYEHLHLRTGDGYRGWPEAAPFDAILVTAAPDHIPQPLVDQLAPGGVLVIPVGTREQEILRLRRTPDGIVRESMLPVRFVPMTGEAEREGQEQER